MTQFIEAIQGSQAIWRLGWTLLHTLWVAAAVAAVYAVVLGFLRRRSANARYLAGCVALALMVALPVAVFFVIAAPPAPAGATAVEAGGDSVMVEARPVVTPPIAPIEAPAPLVVAVHRQPAPPAHEAGPEAQQPPLPERFPEAVSPALPWIVLFWAGGVVVLALWQLGGWIAVQRLKRLATQPTDRPLAEAVARLARAMRVSRPVKVLESMLVRVPTVIGWLRPVILLPAGVATGLTPQQLEAILAHELAHIRRYDYLVNLLQSLAETLLFYHPAVWLVSRRVRTERENCCDDIAVAAGAERFCYAESLLHLAQRSGRAGRGRRLAPAAAVAATGKPSQLRSRIRRLLSGGDEKTTRLARSWPIALACLAIALMTTCLLVTAGTEPATPADTPATQTADAAQIERLIKQLGSAEYYKEREAAQQALVKIGLPAVGSLLQAAADNDPERATRAKAALGQIEVTQAITSKALLLALWQTEAARAHIPDKQRALVARLLPEALAGGKLNLSEQRAHDLRGSLRRYLAQFRRQFTQEYAAQFEPPASGLGAAEYLRGKCYWTAWLLVQAATREPIPANMAGAVADLHAQHVARLELALAVRLRQGGFAEAGTARAAADFARRLGQLLKDLRGDPLFPAFRLPPKPAWMDRVESKKLPGYASGTRLPKLIDREDNRQALALLCANALAIEELVPKLIKTRAWGHMKYSSGGGDPQSGLWCINVLFRPDPSMNEALGWTPLVIAAAPVAPARPWAKPTGGLASTEEWARRQAALAKLDGALATAASEADKLKLLSDAMRAEPASDARFKILSRANILSGPGRETWLLEILKDAPDCFLRGGAAARLGETGSSKAVEPLVAAAYFDKKSHSYIGCIRMEGTARRQAIFALAELATRLPKTQPRILKALRELPVKIDEADPESLGDARLQALYQLTGDAELIQPFFQRLKDADEKVRKQGVVAFRFLKLRKAPKELIAALADSSPEVTSWAALVLGEIGDPSAAKALMAAAEDRKLDRTTRINAIVSLKKMKVRAAEVMMARLTKDPDSGVASHAAAALEVIRSIEREQPATDGSRQPAVRDASPPASQPGTGTDAIQGVIRMLDLPWQEKITDEAWDQAVTSIRPAVDEAVATIMKEFDAGHANDFSFRHRAVQVLERLATPKAKAALIDIALGRTAAELPSLKQWAASSCIRTLTDKTEARVLLSSDDAGVLNVALLAIQGITLDRPLMKQLRSVLAREDKEPNTRMILFRVVALVMVADPGSEFAGEKVDAILAAAGQTPDMPDAGELPNQLSGTRLTFAEIRQADSLQCLSKMKNADAPLREAVGRTAGLSRDIACIALAKRGDVSMRPEMLRILQDDTAGLLRKWAAEGLGTAGTSEDVPLLKRLAESDPLEREEINDVGPRSRKVYPVRQAARRAAELLSKRQPATQPGAGAEGE